MKHLISLLTALVFLAACGGNSTATADSVSVEQYFGTLEPFASESVYFIVTDRFVDGDASNNFPRQGGVDLGSFDTEIKLQGMAPANIGYLGGDFRGVLDNADYISEMGFTAVWLTPIIDNPDEAFTGGIRPGEGFGADLGKSGYHGYWGVNFFEVDEHLESPDLSFADLTRSLANEHDLKFVLDVVCNHGSPSYSMPEDQEKYGELYDADGVLVADHQNLRPQELDPENPLHRFYHREPDLAQLSNLNDENPEVLEYFVAAYTQWLDQGVAAFRIDTIKHMPHAFWQQFSERMRQERPGLFIFAESYTFDAAQIAQHTWPENGGISVLDFPGQEAMGEVFAGEAPYADLLTYLNLESQLYQNPYELMTFYDNHDISRLDADENGFIDAHNWMFTSRGIPVVYYGSEIGFRAGTPEHGGNRDYFGQENVELARSHPIRAELSKIAAIRKNAVSLQRGLQLNLEFTADTAAFYRVYQQGGEQQTALVLLNKANDEKSMAVAGWTFGADWVDAESGQQIEFSAGDEVLTVPAHGVRVILTANVFANATYRDALRQLQKTARRN